MLNEYCRDYRLTKNLRLRDLVEPTQVKTLSAFEMGRSSNIKHFELYVKLSVELKDYDNFMFGLKKVIK